MSPESFTLQESIAVLAMVVLGGMGHIPGVILGALLLAALPELLRSSMGPLQQALFGQVLIDPEIIRQLFYGLALILVMLYRPAGLWRPATHGERRMTPLLALHHISKRFGGLTAVDDVSMSIRQGKSTA